MVGACALQSGTPSVGSGQGLEVKRGMLWSDGGAQMDCQGQRKPLTQGLSPRQCLRMEAGRLKGRRGYSRGKA